jgi:hypothetical protein
MLGRGQVEMYQNWAIQCPAQMQRLQSKHTSLIKEQPKWPATCVADAAACTQLTLLGRSCTPPRLRGSRIAASVIFACIKKPHPVQHNHVTLGRGTAVQQAGHKHRTSLHTQRCTRGADTATCTSHGQQHTALQLAPPTQTATSPPPLPIHSPSPSAVAIHRAFSTVQLPLQQPDTTAPPTPCQARTHSPN